MRHRSAACARQARARWGVIVTSALNVLDCPAVPGVKTVENQRDDEHFVHSGRGPHDRACGAACCRRCPGASGAAAAGLHDSSGSSCSIVPHCTAAGKAQSLQKRWAANPNASKRAWGSCRPPRLSWCAVDRSRSCRACAAEHPRAAAPRHGGAAARLGPGLAALARQPLSAQRRPRHGCERGPAGRGLGAQEGPGAGPAGRRLPAGTGPGAAGGGGARGSPRPGGAAGPRRARAAAAALRGRRPACRCVARARCLECGPCALTAPSPP